MRNAQEKKFLIDIAVRYFIDLCPDNMPAKSACLVWALSAYRALLENKERPIIQAGTCLWPRIREDQDDGETSTHFGYEWHYDAQTRYLISEGRLPEMHVWIAILNTNEIVDLSTGYFTTRCQEIIGMNWPGDRPPRYLWCEADKIPDRVIYKPYFSATKVAVEFAEKLLQECTNERSQQSDKRERHNQQHQNNPGSQNIQQTRGCRKVLRLPHYRLG